MNTNNEQSSVRLTYKKLDAWIMARTLAIKVMAVTEREGLKRCWGLCDQMQRAAISVPSNIAEGDERGSNLDALRFLYISKGSLAELRTQIDIAQASGKISATELEELESLAGTVGRLLGGMIRLRIKNRNLSRHSD